MYTALRQMVQTGIETWGVRQFAEQVDVAPELLAAGSAADFAGWDTAMVGRVASALGFDAWAALRDEALPTPKLLAFLRDTWGGLDPNDGPTVRRALSWSSMLREAGLRASLTYTPKRAPGKDVFQAGYAMARRLRRDLGNEEGPIADLREVVELSLGVVIVIAPLYTPRMEALAVGNESGAAILLNRDAPRRASYLRRSVAHELCHLLFDPRSAGGAVLDVIARASEDLPVPHGQLENREQRARAFAAELLVPERGLRGHFVGCTAALDEARARALQVCSTFGAPWELVVWHLHNHEVIAEAARDQLLLESGRDLPGPGLGRAAARDWVYDQIQEGEVSEGWVRGMYGPNWYSELGDP